MNYRMTVAYDGTRYLGWQKQKESPNTIQQKLETVLSRMAGVPVDVHGAGRTDAGVHALGQIAQFLLPEDTDPDKIRSYCNRYLPDDIAVLSVSRAAPRFHSRYNAREKIYTYRVTSDMSRHVFERRYLTRYPEEAPYIRMLLDIEAMRRAAADLCGTHDFRSFNGNPHMKKSTVKTIFSIEIEENEDELALIFTGSGFLQYMVRILAGTLLEVGEGRRPADSMPDLLAARDRKLAGPTAPPEGLILTKVVY